MSYTSNNQTYENFILTSKATDLLTTAVNAQNFMKIDNSLALEAGMIRKFNTYTFNGEVEEVAEGEGNSGVGNISFVTKAYEVKTLQSHLQWSDEQILTDPLVKDFSLKGCSELFTNKMTEDYYTALNTVDEDDALLIHNVTFAKNGAISYDTVVDAIAELNTEDENGLFLLIGTASKAAIRKDPEFKAAKAGEILFSGEIGSISGVRVVVTKAIADNTCYLAHKDAVTLFIKKGTEVETSRNADCRLTDTFVRTVYVVVLTDATKAVKITEAAQ